MDSEGYIVIKEFFPVDELLEKVLPFVQHTQAIFNGPGHNDHKRKQTKLPSYYIKNLKKKLSSSEHISSAHTLKDFVLLRSLPGCKRQQAHTDYIPDSVLKHCPIENQPLLFLFALQKNTNLVVWPGSHKLIQGLGRTIEPIQPKKVTLAPGDAILFRADLVHAGAEYDIENIRIHCYIDSPFVPRNPNKTWILKKHADSLVQEKIIEV